MEDDDLSANTCRLQRNWKQRLFTFKVKVFPFEMFAEVRYNFHSLLSVCVALCQVSLLLRELMTTVCSQVSIF